MTANLHSGTLATDEYTLDEASNYTISSTSFTDVDGTHLALQLTPGSKAASGQALVGVHVNVAMPTGTVGYFNLLVNGTLNAANDGILAVQGTLPASFTRLITNLNVGTLNSVRLQAKVTGGGTMTVYNGAGTSGLDLHGQFWGVVL
jgi:hypothetical protein